MLPTTKQINRPEKDKPLGFTRGRPWLAEAQVKVQGVGETDINNGAG